MHSLGPRPKLSTLGLGLGLHTMQLTSHMVLNHNALPEKLILTAMMMLSLMGLGPGCPGPA